MNFDFYTSHIKTICDLQSLAEKHNCTLAFGTSNSIIDREIDQHFLEKYFNCPKDIAEEICEKCSFEEVIGDHTNSYFELYDNNKEKYNTLSYFTISATFKITIDFSFNEDDNLSERAKDWLIQNCMNDEWGYEFDDEFYMYVDTTEEEVYGFDGIEKEWNIYRPGIMLAVFTQLVCDYLKEERIVRTY